MGGSDDQGGMSSEELGNELSQLLNKYNYSLSHGHPVLGNHVPRQLVGRTVGSGASNSSTAHHTSALQLNDHSGSDLSGSSASSSSSAAGGVDHSHHASLSDHINHATTAAAKHIVGQFPTDIDQVVTSGIGSLFRSFGGSLAGLTGSGTTAGQQQQNQDSATGGKAGLAAAGAAGTAAAAGGVKGSAAASAIVPAAGKTVALSGGKMFLLNTIYFLKSGFLIFGALCSKLFGMGLIGFMAFQSMSAPRSELPPLRPQPIDLTRSVLFYGNNADKGTTKGQTPMLENGANGSSEEGLNGNGNGNTMKNHSNLGVIAEESDEDEESSGDEGQSSDKKKKSTKSNNNDDGEYSESTSTTDSLKEPEPQQPTSTFGRFGGARRDLTWKWTPQLSSTVSQPSLEDSKEATA